MTGNGFANPNSQEGDGIMVDASGGSGLEIAYNTLSGNKHGIIRSPPTAARGRSGRW